MTPGQKPHALSARTLANCPLCLKPLPNDDHSVSDRLGGVRIVGCPAMPTSEVMVTGVASAGSQEPAPMLALLHLIPRLQSIRGMCTDEEPHEMIDRHVGGVVEALERLRGNWQEPAPARKFGSVDGAPAVRDDRTWTITVDKDDEARAVGDIVDSLPPKSGMGLVAVEVVPRSELARVQDQLDQAREALADLITAADPFFAHADKPELFEDGKWIMALGLALYGAALAASGVTEKGDG